MRHKAETHKPGSVVRIISGSDGNEEQAEIGLADPAQGKLRIANFLLDDMDRKHRLKQGDAVDVVIGSDEVEPEKE